MFGASRSCRRLTMDIFAHRQCNRRLGDCWYLFAWKQYLADRDAGNSTTPVPGREGANIVKACLGVQVDQPTDFSVLQNASSVQCYLWDITLLFVQRQDNEELSLCLSSLQVRQAAFTACSISLQTNGMWVGPPPMAPAYIGA